LVRISNETIDELRASIRTKTMASNQQKFESTQSSSGLQPYMKFLSNFSQYNGLVMYYKLLEPRTEEIQNAYNIISSSIGVYEKQLMAVYNCSPEWPVCLYDFSHKNRVPNYICLKVKKSLNEHIIANYFTQDYLAFKAIKSHLSP